MVIVFFDFCNFDLDFVVDLDYVMWCFDVFVVELWEVYEIFEIIEVDEGVEVGDWGDFVGYWFVVEYVFGECL